MQGRLIPKHAERRRIITAPRAALYKISPISRLLAILMCNAEFSMALNTAKIETLVAIDLAETGAAHIRRVVTLRAVGKV